MKKTLIIAFSLSVLSMQSCMHKTDSEMVPEEVLAAFNAKFKDYKKLKWEKENEEEWEAEFVMDEKEYSANFLTNGDWKETEYEIKGSDLPDKILYILNENFSDYKIKECEIVLSNEGTSYEMEIKTNKEEFEILIDSKGNLTKQENED
ncbi:MAG: hypothetical protein CMO01_24505 [Thalassobius sp.]|nr:hypothetical protein [Thalassovita sp.]